MQNDSEGYTIAKAYTHLKKARRLLKESGVLNYKTEGSFNALMTEVISSLDINTRNRDERPRIPEKT